MSLYHEAFLVDLCDTIEKHDVSTDALLWSVACILAPALDLPTATVAKTLDRMIRRIRKNIRTAG